MKNKAIFSSMFIVFVTIFGIMCLCLLLVFANAHGERIRVERKKAQEKQEMLEKLEELRKQYSY